MTNRDVVNRAIGILSYHPLFIGENHEEKYAREIVIDVIRHLSKPVQRLFLEAPYDPKWESASSAVVQQALDQMENAFTYWGRKPNGIKYSTVHAEATRRSIPVGFLDHHWRGADAPSARERNNAIRRNIATYGIRQGDLILYGDAHLRGADNIATYGTILHLTTTDFKDTVEFEDTDHEPPPRRRRVPIP